MNDVNYDFRDNYVLRCEAKDVRQTNIAQITLQNIVSKPQPVLDQNMTNYI